MLACCKAAYVLIKVTNVKLKDVADFIILYALWLSNVPHESSWGPTLYKVTYKACNRGRVQSPSLSGLACNLHVSCTIHTTDES